MNAVSQNGGRKPRPWTVQEQITAEVAAACGASHAEIGLILGRTYHSVRYRLEPSVATNARNRAKQWRQQNPSLHAERNKKWAEANRDKSNAIKRRWKMKNRDKQKACDRRWRVENPDKSNDITRRRRARLRANNASALCRMTFQARQKRFLLWRNSCAYCGAKHDLTVDHVLAIKHHGLDEPSNIVPACRICNSSKNDSPIETWYLSQPFFTETRWRKIQRHCPASLAGQLPLSLTA
jgi:hypothetical protein